MAELVAPIMPDIAGSFAPLARGLAQMAQNRRYAQQLELNYQKQAQDAALEQQNFELKRQQLAQQMPLQQAQIENYLSEAKYRNRVLTDAAQKKQDALTSLSPLQQQVDSVPYTDLGTDKGYATLSEIFNDPAHEAALQTPQGLKIRSNAWSRQRLAESRRADDYRIANSAYDQSLKKIGIGEGSLDALSLQGKKIITTGNEWRTNPDGSVYQIVVPPDASSTVPRVLTTDEYQPGKPDVKGETINKAPVAGASFKTLTPDYLSQLFQMRNMVQSYRKKLPLSALQDAHAQQYGDQQQAEQQRAVTAGVVPAPPAPPSVAVDYLRSNPQTAAAFDAKYGQGASAQILGQ